MSERPWVVIGSGPSGAAVTAALIRAGIRPIVLDGGRDAEPSAEQRREAARAEAPPSVPARQPTRGNPGQKTWFGSAASFEQEGSIGLVYGKEVVARASFGVGGLSRVWGATFAFFESWSSWPDGTRPGDADLSLVRGLVPASATTWPGRGAGTIEGARSSLGAMTRFARHADPAKWEVLPSSVAIDSRDGSETRCQPCGRCLSGCPRDAIWFSGSLVARWARDGLVDYRPGLVVRELREDRNLVSLSVLDRGAALTLVADRVFVAAGAISTAALLVNSSIVAEVVIQDTRAAFAAALSLHREPRAIPSHALSQWWARSRDGRVSIQVYPPNGELAGRVAERIPPARRLGPILRRGSLRLHPVIAYLDASLSDRLRIAGSPGSVQVGAIGSSSTTLFRGPLAEVANIFMRAGYWMPLRFVEYATAGTGYHFGASLPHGVASDTLGRPNGLSRIHVVDASVLPRLEVGSITPTVMANAARIGREASLLRGLP